MPAWVVAGYQEYAKRLPREMCPSIVEIPIGYRGKNSAVDDAMRHEGQAILQAIPEQNHKIMLDLQGKPWSTAQLAGQLAKWQMDGANLSFVIGGPDGYSQACIQQADSKWCLSNLTLPHPLVRILFIEQLYRAWTVLQNHPYHK